MPRIIAYTYDADTHCVPCAQERFGHVCPTPNTSLGFEPGTRGLRLCGECPMLDEHGLPAEGAIDPEGNPVRPIFDGDEWWRGSTIHVEYLACSARWNEAPSEHIGVIAEHIDEDYCACNDGCLDGECYGCQDAEEQEQDDDDDDREPENEPADWCTCVSCLAASRYVPGEPTPDYAALAEVPVAYNVDEPAPVAPVTLSALAGEGDGLDWADESEPYGGSGAACRASQPDGRRYECERVFGHPGMHGAFGSQRRRDESGSYSRNQYPRTVWS